MDNLIKLAVEQDEERVLNEKEAQSQILIRLAANMELFHSDDSEPYATFKVKDHFETWPLGGKKFKLWLIKLFHEEYGKAVGSQGLADALNVLGAKALFEGEQHKVFTRIAEKDGAIYIDLCNDKWEAIKVDAFGWEIITNPPVKFKRSKTTKEIPRPVKGGRIEELKKYINYKDEGEWVLIVSWLIAALRPGRPYPILTLQGEQGSAKSTTSRVLRLIVDPSTLPLRAISKDERDLAIAANNAWILAFDNLSGLSNMMSDALCKLSTGGGLATRKLHTDDEEVIFNIMRPTILNGIDDIAKRQDLLDRSLVLFLPSIPEENRSDEETFWHSFQEAHPRILGGLLDVLSGAIKELPNTDLTAKPRMADFALWSTAAEKALGWDAGTFISAYNKNRSDAIDQGLESDPVAVAVQAFMNGRPSWEGTVENTLNELSKHTDEKTKHSRAWPSSRKLKERLRRMASALRLKGIEFIDLGRTNKGATIRLEKAEETSSLSSLPTQAFSDHHLIEGDRVTISVNGAGVKRKSSHFEGYYHKNCDDNEDSDDKKPSLPMDKSGLI